MRDLRALDAATVVALGPVGVGKSSCLNTVASYLAGHLEQAAGCGVGTASLTTQTQLHNVRSPHGTPLRWRWLDTPGGLFEDLVNFRSQLACGYDADSDAAYDRFVDETVLELMRRHRAGCVMAMLSAAAVSEALLHCDERGRDLGRARLDPGSRMHSSLQVRGAKVGPTREGGAVVVLQRPSAAPAPRLTPRLGRS